MFDGLAILLALFLYHKAESGYRNIAFFVLCFFIVSDVIAHHFFFDLRESNHWLIYQLYNTVNAFVIWKLKKLGVSLFILAILTVNVLLNIVVSMWFVSNLIPDAVYNTYPYTAGFLMALCLFYLWMVSYGIRLGDKQGNNSNFIGSILRVWLGNMYRVRLKRFER